MTDTHYNDPLDSSKPLSGTGRKGWEVPAHVQQKVVDIIIEEGRKRRMNNRDIAHYLAIAKRESQFNPDAANAGSTAAGIAQMLDKTGKTYGLNDSNRFDARASINAGIGYFLDLQKATVADYGNAAGVYEPLIYYRYHYGEYSTKTRHIRQIKSGKKTYDQEYFVPKTIGQLQANSRYADSKTVVDEAARIEKILGDAHGLVVKLADVLGKPMAGRKVIVVEKVRKSPPPAATAPASPPAPKAPVPQPAPQVTAPTAASPVPVAPPVAAADSTPPSTAATAPPADGTAPASDAAGNATPVATPPGTPSTDATPATTLDVSAIASTTSETDEPLALPDEDQSVWEVRAYEVTTNADGELPEIVSESQQQVVVLIPRLDYEAYNQAVASNAIAENGNEHQIATHTHDDGGAPAIPAPAPPEPPPKPAPPPVVPPQAAPKPPVKPAPPPLVIPAPAAKPKPAPPPVPKEITFGDVVTAVKAMGWDAVYSTSFSYVKRFYTRPKLPAAPLTNPSKTVTAPARTQVISGSLPNREIKVPKVEAKVTTAPKTAVKPVAVAGEASWMPFALKEQTKADEVREVTGQQKDDSEWKTAKSERNAAEAAAKSARAKLRTEKRKKLPVQATVDALNAEIIKQDAAAAAANTEMLKLEEQYNNKDIVKYLQTTSLDRDSARDDDTPWCASFTNWCVEQAGYNGTDNAGAISWANWGEKIDEPRYGAITVVTRDYGKHHVGFFLSIVEKDVTIGVEEVEVTGKDGKVRKKKVKKTKKVKYVRLLSGNYSGRVKEGDAWAVEAADNPKLHLVSYHWPTKEDKR